MEVIRKLDSDPRVQRALQLLEDRSSAITDLQVRFAEIPSPNHRAPGRAELLQQILREMKLEQIRIDAAGNVIGVLPGTGKLQEALVLSAHLDSVFPELDTIEIKREGSILRGPGIADDAAGLAALVHLVKAIGDSGLELQRDIAIAGTVGEEGEGDLRGVKHLFEVEYPPERVLAFITLDLGAHEHAVNAGLGSRRLQVTIRGPGGHSWGDFGRPNPIHALVRGVDRFLRSVPKARKRTSYNIGTVEGGRGVNVIPESAKMRIDLRSESPQTLLDLEAALRKALRNGLEEERHWSRNGSTLEQHIDVIGDRPVGETPMDSKLVRTVLAAFAARRLALYFGRSSTDANVPMSLGVHAVALPHGVIAYNAHSLDEWCDVRGRETVLQAELLSILALAELTPAGLGASDKA